MLTRLIERLEQCFYYRDVRRISQKDSKITQEDVDRFYINKLQIRLIDCKYHNNEVKKKRFFRQLSSAILYDFPKYQCD